MLNQNIEKLKNFLIAEEEENILQGLEILAQNSQFAFLFKEYLLALGLLFNKKHPIYIQSEHFLTLIFSKEFIFKFREDKSGFHTTNLALIESYFHSPDLDKNIFLNLLILYTKNDSTLIFFAWKKGIKLEKFSVKHIKTLSFRYAYGEKYLTFGNPDLSVFENLEYLDLSYNTLSYIPLCIKELYNLNTLIISHNQIIEIPDDFFEKLIKLEKIEAQRNLISSISSSLTRCKSLISIQLQNNQINVFPEFLCELYNLEELNLSNNLIRQIPIQIDNLKQLSKLYLANNLIVSIPLSLQSLYHLRNCFKTCVCDL